MQILQNLLNNAATVDTTQIPPTYNALNSNQLNSSK